MSMNFEELDNKTREYMLIEFDKEINSGNPYLSKKLTEIGKLKFLELMRNAVKNGTEITLYESLLKPEYWVSEELYTRNGVTNKRKVNYLQAALRLAITEFSTWYVAGLAKKLLDEGEQNCKIYRGQIPKFEPGDCSSHEGKIVSVKEIYNNHRLRYWPEPGDDSKFSIPFGPGCHHIIKRIKN
jgi:hypothetical protein